MKLSLSRKALWPFPFLALLLSGTHTPAVGQGGEEVQAPRPIELQDILGWKRIVGPTLSDNGAWFAHRLSPTEGNSELVVRSTSSDTEYRFPVGERGGTVAFSDDSRWLAFAITPTKDEADGPRGGGTPPKNKMGLLDLTSGEMTEVEDIQSFTFSGEQGGWIALRRYPASAGAPSGAGAALPGGAGPEEVTGPGGLMSSFMNSKPGCD